MADPVNSAASIRFGRFELSADSGELRKDGVRLKLSGQAIQVLAMLAASPGQLVTREELQQKLWPGASYGDPEHGLNAAVNRLRETLGDSATESIYIETVPGRGYRFIAALDSEVVPSEPEPPKPPWWKRKAVIAVAALVVLAGSLYPWMAPRIERLWRLYELQQLTVVPLTTLEGFVFSPSFSPDGTEVAFVRGKPTGMEDNELYVKVIGTENPLRLTHRGYVGPAVWSPDGRNIAFGRCIANDCGVFLISPLGGPERKIISVSWFSLGSLNWSPDGKQLAFLDDRLFVLSLDSMEKVPIKTDCRDVRTPAFSPRGDYLAWTCVDNFSDISINLQRRSDGSVTQLLRRQDGVGSIAWSSDGRRILFTAGFNSPGNIWEVDLAKPSHPEKLPVGHDANGVAVSPKGNRLAFMQHRININIWRLDLSQPQVHAQKVVGSTRQQSGAQYSPDGTQIAFGSDRSGSGEVWVSDADGSNAVQLSSFGVTSGSPRWSPDGKRIAFDSQVGGEANIYIVDPHGGVPKKLNIDIHGNLVPEWSHDGAWIYFVNGANVRHPSLWKVPYQGGRAVQVAQYPAGFFFESPDGRYVYFDRDGWLWRVNTDGTGEQKVQGMPQLSGTSDRWTPFGSGIYFVAGEIDNTEIDFLDLDTQKIRRVYLMDKPPASGWMGGLSVSKDGRWLLFAQTDEFSSDLMLVENWR